MSYNATSWVDGTTPVNASNLNKLEGGVADLSSAVDELQESPVIVPFYQQTTVEESPTEFAYTGVSITLPANVLAVFLLYGVYSGSACYEIGLGGSTDTWVSSTAYFYGEGSTIVSNGQPRVVCIVRPASETTYYVWGRWRANATNRVQMYGFYFKL